MGLYSVFLGLGQIIGALLGGRRPRRPGASTASSRVALVLLAIALVPLAHLRRYEHYVAAGKPVDASSEEA